MKVIIKKEVTKVETREVTRTEEKEVDVSLRKSGNNVLLVIDGWHVFRLNSDGTGKLIGSIGGRSGLQVDYQGKIVMEN